MLRYVLYLTYSKILRKDKSGMEISMEGGKSNDILHAWLPGAFKCCTTNVGMLQKWLVLTYVWKLSSFSTKVII
jgi:hypothetical protein